MASTLLRRGTVLQHDKDDHIQVRKNTDILIRGNKIVDIAEGIEVSEEVEVVDCKDKLISPGFIDTHHHVWQTQLKGRHANETLLEYFYSGNFNSSVYTPEDVFWGQLGGCLEMLSAGTTTVVDHAHINYSPNHNHNAISATVSSGIRSVYCYCPTPRASTWNPLTLAPDLLPPFVLSTFDDLISTTPWGNGRVTLGFAFDAWYLPKPTITSLFEKVNATGVIKTITSHSVRNATMGAVSLPELLDSYGLLDSKILLSHSTNMTPREKELCNEKKFWISSTPDSEMQMGHGFPVCFDQEVQAQCGLGVDCHSNNSGDLVGQMRLGLQGARARANDEFHRAGKEPRRVFRTVEQAFNLGTIQGARAIGMQNSIGSIGVGKVADLLVWDTDTVAMVCAAQHDPVAAVVLHSSPADICHVVVDGVFRKRDGKLLPTDLDGRGRDVAGKERLEWKEIARRLVEGRERLQEEIETHDVGDARKVVLERFHIDESKIVDKI